MLSGRDKFSVDVSNNQPVALRLGNTSSENNPSRLHVLILKGKIYPISYKIFKAFTASKSTQVQNQIIDIITA